MSYEFIRFVRPSCINLGRDFGTWIFGFEGLPLSWNLIINFDRIELGMKSIFFLLVVVQVTHDLT